MQECPVCKEQVATLSCVDGEEFVCSDCALQQVKDREREKEEQHEQDKVSPDPENMGDDEHP